MVFKLTENDNSTEISVKIENSTKSDIQEQSKPIDVSSNNDSSASEIEIEDSEITIEKLQDLLLKEKQKAVTLDEKLKRTLADFQNLERKTKSDIEIGINNKN